MLTVVVVVRHEELVFGCKVTLTDRVFAIPLQCSFFCQSRVVFAAFICLLQLYVHVADCYQGLASLDICLFFFVSIFTFKYLRVISLLCCKSMCRHMVVICSLHFCPL